MARNQDSSPVAVRRLLAYCICSQRGLFLHGKPARAIYCTSAAFHHPSLLVDYRDYRVYLQITIIIIDRAVQQSLATLRQPTA